MSNPFLNCSNWECVQVFSDERSDEICLIVDWLVPNSMRLQTSVSSNMTVYGHLTRLPIEKVKVMSHATNCNSRTKYKFTCFSVLRLYLF